MLSWWGTLLLLTHSLTFFLNHVLFHSNDNYTSLCHLKSTADCSFLHHSLIPQHSTYNWKMLYHWTTYVSEEVKSPGLLQKQDFDAITVSFLHFSFPAEWEQYCIVLFVAMFICTRVTCQASRQRMCAAAETSNEDLYTGHQNLYTGRTQERPVHWYLRAH